MLMGRKNISKKRLMQGLKPIQDLEVTDVKIDNVQFNPQIEKSIALLSSNGKQFAFILDEIVGPMMTFIRSGCAKNPHIPSVYDNFIGMMKHMGITLDNVTIESKHGDVVYASMEWVDSHNNRFWQKCNYGDAIIFTSLTDRPLKIVQAALSEMDTMDEQGGDDQEDDGMRL